MMCLTHTHIYIYIYIYIYILLTTGLVQLWLPTKHWEINCSLKEKTVICGVFCLFKSVIHAHTHLGYQMGRIWSATEVARKEGS